MNTRIKLSDEARKILDEFVASRERWFGNSTDYKTWASVCKVLWHEEEVMQDDSHNNSFVAYLEYLAEFCAKKFSLEKQEKT